MAQNLSFQLNQLVNKLIFLKCLCGMSAKILLIIKIIGVRVKLIDYLGHYFLFDCPSLVAQLFLLLLVSKLNFQLFSA
jgi:hypothetical protein